MMDIYNNTLFWTKLIAIVSLFTLCNFFNSYAMAFIPCGIKTIPVALLYRSTQWSKIPSSIKRHHNLYHNIIKHKTIYFSSASNQQEKELVTLLQNENDEPFISEQIIKKSRFIGIAKYCTSWSTAQEFIQNIRVEHSKSRHVCFAFVSSSSAERCSDDGEPTGTAGLPILSAIKGDDLSDVVCVVVRYYGGIKLGAGGLIRAYGSSARQVLRDATKTVLIPKTTIQLFTPSIHAGNIYSVAMKYNAQVSDETYDADGNLSASIVCDSELADVLMSDIQDGTRGSVTFT